MSQGLLSAETRSEFVNWLFYSLLGLCLLLQVLKRLMDKEHQEGSKDPKFVAFQVRYVMSFLCAAMADWLKGPYIYIIYQEAGFEKPQIATLFIAGCDSVLIFDVDAAP